MPNLLDDVANDLALWIDQTAAQLALAFAPTGEAPFAAPVSEQEKLDYYRSQLFNPDGTPNLQGRAAEMQRLGPEGFTQVYKAVLRAYPSLRVPSPPPGAIPGAAVPATQSGVLPAGLGPPAGAPPPVPSLPRNIQTVRPEPGAMP